MAREFEPTPEMIPSKDFRLTPSRRLQQIIEEPVIHDLQKGVIPSTRYGALTDAIMLYHKEATGASKNSIRKEKAGIKKLQRIDPEYRREYDDMSALVSRTEDIFVKSPHPLMNREQFANNLFLSMILLTNKEKEFSESRGKQPQPVPEKLGKSQLTEIPPFTDPDINR